MRYVIAVVLCLGAVALIGQGNAGDAGGATRAGVMYIEGADMPQCVRLAKYRRSLRRAIRFSAAGGNYVAVAIRPRGRERLVRQRGCWAQRRAWERVRRMRKMERERMAEWRFHRKIDALTPWGEWAIPTGIVMCESGGDYGEWNDAGSGASGAYQIMPGTWAGYGGGRFARHAAYAPPWAQHIVAARIYRAEGSGPWSCA